MAFGSFDSRSSGTTMSEINMVPLIDVMLVLLIIFMVTAPLLSHSIQINLPRVSAQALSEAPQAIDVSVEASGRLYWNETPTTLEALARQITQAAGQEPQPEVRIRADADARYGLLAEIMAVARKAGIQRLGFVTQPAPDAAAPAAP